MARGDIVKSVWFGWLCRLEKTNKLFFSCFSIKKQSLEYFGGLLEKKGKKKKKRKKAKFFLFLFFFDGVYTREKEGSWLVGRRAKRASCRRARKAFEAAERTMDDWFAMLADRWAPRPRRASARGDCARPCHRFARDEAQGYLVLDRSVRHGFPCACLFVPRHGNLFTCKRTRNHGARKGRKLPSLARERENLPPCERLCASSVSLHIWSLTLKRVLLFGMVAPCRRSARRQRRARQ